MSDTNETVNEDGNIDPRDAEIEKLRQKNKELVAEKAKHKQKVQDAQDAADEAEARAAANSGDIDALKASHAKELKKLQDQLDGRDADLRTIRVDQEINKALLAHQVRPEMMAALTALFKTQAEYKDGAGLIQGEPIGDAVGAYMASEAGAHFRQPTANSGGGATGNTQTASQEMTAANWDNTKFMQMAATNPAEARATAVAAGKHALAASIK